VSATRVSITESDLHLKSDDRFDRFRLIGWWDQERLAKARVLVIGAGALGNEIIKNLALLGVGDVFIADLDRIENSNLSRSVLYREADNGSSKAEVAARAARSIYPKINAHFFNGNVIYDLGVGVFRWADVVLGGLDNREARLAINRNCYRVGRPWIDGAIEQIQGVARVFVPDGPCYECTMSELDWQLLQKRRSCNLLTRDEMETGKTPTTPTISSIIAGVQCQEAVKLLHGLPTICGRGWVFDGSSADSYQVEYQLKDDCLSHDPPELYRVEYRVRGLVRGNGGTPQYRDEHRVEIQLTRDYPRQSPKCKMLTPIFHPNIEPAIICVGDHWTAAERLVDLVIRIGEMITYQAYNIKSPLDGEAAMWADLNRKLLPIDNCSLQPPDLD
jgi:molybdopterin/thiamine biosynthesis adenylyltransferase/ubiquitin-protein ligase